jgi:hypothetical protein
MEAKKEEEKKEVVFFCKDNPRPLIPEGVYEAICTNYDSSFNFGKCRKLFLNFKIISTGPYFETKLFCAFNMRYDRGISAGSNYYKAWCMANNWQKPSRNAGMSARIFKNRVFDVKVETVEPKHNGVKMPKNHHYSKVAEILRPKTGIIECETSEN